MTSNSLSDAAVKLGRSQPAVSAAIKALEDQLGLPLFERRGRKLIPVPEAQYLLAEADEILSQMTRVRQTMQSLAKGEAGSVTVAAMPGPMSLVFPKFIASHLQGFKDVSVSIQARTSQQIAELARAQSIDFGFADAPEAGEEETLFSAETIEADCFVALPNGHALAANDQIVLEDLDAVPLGMLSSTHFLSKNIRYEFELRGLNMVQSVESQTFLPILHFVAAGQCCTLFDPLSKFLVEGENAMIRGIVVRPMANPIRYRYALFAPQYRPISVVAQDLLSAWRREVLFLLKEIGSRPFSSEKLTT